MVDVVIPLASIHSLFALCLPFARSGKQHMMLLNMALRIQSMKAWTSSSIFSFIYIFCNFNEIALMQRLPHTMYKL